jgi:RNA-directed DNA polymerase
MPQVRKFLGFSFTSGITTKRRLAPQTVSRFKARVRELTHRTRGRSLAQIVKELSVYLIGWRGYFGFCETSTVLRALEQWTSRRLGAIAWKQWKRGRTRFKQVIKRGVDVALAAPTAGSPHGPWRISISPALAIAFPNASFAALGLSSLVSSKPHNSPNRRIRTRTYGGVGGAAS